MVFLHMFSIHMVSPSSPRDWCGRCFSVLDGFGKNRIFHVVLLTIEHSLIELRMGEEGWENTS